MLTIRWEIGHETTFITRNPNEKSILLSVKSFIHYTTTLNKQFSEK